MSATKMNKGKANSKKALSKTQVSPTALVYRGPSRLPRSEGQNDVFTSQINNTGSIVSSAGGQITTVFDDYSQTSTPTDWTSFQNLYTEYRILSMELEMIPWNKYNMPTTTVCPPVYSVLDRANNTPLGSIAQAVAYDSVEIHEPSTRFKRVVKMNSVEESQWIAIGSSPATAARFYIKLYCTGASNSTTYYDFVTRMVIQFRGRQ